MNSSKSDPVEISVGEFRHSAMESLNEMRNRQFSMRVLLRNTDNNELVAYDPHDGNELLRCGVPSLREDLHLRSLMADGREIILIGSPVFTGSTDRGLPEVAFSVLGSRLPGSADEPSYRYVYLKPSWLKGEAAASPDRLSGTDIKLSGYVSNLLGRVFYMVDDPARKGFPIYGIISDGVQCRLRGGGYEAMLRKAEASGGEVEILGSVEHLVGSAVAINVESVKLAG